MTASLRRELRLTLGESIVLPDVPRRYLTDATEASGSRGSADAVVLPLTTEDVVSTVRWSLEHGTPITPRGGGTGFSGGCVPDGGIVVSLERMNSVVAFEPLRWRAKVQAGVTTAEVRRLARTNGVLFPPDPGAAETSQIGGNIATNAGGPHAFKYGVTRSWVTGLEVVLPSGEVAIVGGSPRKDVTGYDLIGLFCGSEGTLGIVTHAWLRFVPLPDFEQPLVAFFDDDKSGASAVENLLGYGIGLSALEFLDTATFDLTRRTFPYPPPRPAAFVVLAEVDGPAGAAAALRGEARDALVEEGATFVWVPEGRAEVEALWRWRDGVSLAVQAARGGKVSEDVDVPVEHLSDLLDEARHIGRRNGLPECSWGHGGDGNVHVTFLVDPQSGDDLKKARTAIAELFETTVRLGGAISGEHGVGTEKRPFVPLQFSSERIRLDAAIKRTVDPLSLMNPGKKVPLDGDLPLDRDVPPPGTGGKARAPTS